MWNSSNPANHVMKRKHKTDEYKFDKSKYSKIDDNEKDEVTESWYICLVCYEAFQEEKHLCRHKTRHHGISKNIRKTLILSQADLLPSLRVKKFSTNHWSGVKQDSSNEQNIHNLGNSSGDGPKMNVGLDKQQDKKPGSWRRRVLILNQKDLIPSIILTRCRASNECKRKPLISILDLNSQSISTQNYEIDAKVENKPHLPATISNRPVEEMVLQLADVQEFSNYSKPNSQIILEEIKLKDDNCLLSNACPLQRHPTFIQQSPVKCSDQLPLESFLENSAVTALDKIIDLLSEPRDGNGNKEFDNLGEIYSTNSFELEVKADELSSSKSILIETGDVAVPPRFTEYTDEKASDLCGPVPRSLRRQTGTEIETNKSDLERVRNHPSDYKRTSSETNEQSHHKARFTNNVQVVRVKILQKSSTENLHHKEDKPCQCQSCNKQFLSLCHLKSHLRVHTWETQFQCKWCYQKFSYKNNFVAHERQIHHILKIGKNGGKNLSYMCLICGKVFIKNKLLKLHMANHIADRPFKCSKCVASFKLKSLLSRHLSSFHDARPFKCEVCGTCFKLNSHLTNHSRIHNNPNSVVVSVVVNL